MATLAVPPIQRIELWGRSWRTYEAFLALQENHSGLRVSFDSGRLEAMVISAQHDFPNRALAKVVELVADELRIDYTAMGSPTIQRPHLEKGFEPDSSYYFNDPASIRIHDWIPTKSPRLI